MEGSPRDTLVEFVRQMREKAARGETPIEHWYLRSGGPIGNLLASLWPTNLDGRWLFWMVDRATETWMPTETDIAMALNVLGLPANHPVERLNDGIQVSWTE